VQDQPVVSAAKKFRRRHAHEIGFDLVRRIRRRKTRAAGDAEDMRIDRERGFAECLRENDIGCLTANAGQGL